MTVANAQSAAVRALQVLAQDGDVDLQETVDLLAELCEAELAAIGILVDEEYHYVITHGVDPLVCPTSDSMCQHMMNTHHAAYVEDASKDVRFALSPYVDGRLMSLRFYASAPIYDAGGEMVGRLCVFDSSPKRMTPFQLRALTTLAASVTDMIELRERRTRDIDGPSAEDEMARIAAEISHDMRVPLASIVANVEMITDELRDKVEPTASLMLARTERNATRLLRMVDELMRFHEVGSGQQLGPVDLQAVLDQVLVTLNPQLDEVRARVRVQGLPVVRADADQLYSVVQNLVSNAAKFARPEVPLEIFVSATRRGDCWRVSVSDNGVGVPDDQRHEMFSMFSRASHRVEGHGIGLATVRRIVHAHGGRVGIDDGTAGGVAIWFELPA